MLMTEEASSLQNLSPLAQLVDGLQRYVTANLNYLNFILALMPVAALACNLNCALCLPY